MIFRPKQSEIAAVVQLLESGNYETASDLASAIIVAVVDELAHRDSYGIARGLASDDLRIAHGPYWDVRDARKAVEHSRGCGLTAYLARLCSPVLPERPGPSNSRCDTCGHATQLHDRHGCQAWPVGRKCACAPA